MAVNINHKVSSNSAKYLQHNYVKWSIYCESCNKYHQVQNKHKIEYQQQIAVPENN